MSETVQPMHDAPECPSCKGSTLMPLAAQDGHAMRPLDIAPRRLESWHKLHCACCGAEHHDASLLDVLQAWYSWGAYEQHRVEQSRDGAL